MVCLILANYYKVILLVAPTRYPFLIPTLTPLLTSFIDLILVGAFRQIGQDLTKLG